MSVELRSYLGIEAPFYKTFSYMQMAKAKQAVRKCFDNCSELCFYLTLSPPDPIREYQDVAFVCCD